MFDTLIVQPFTNVLLMITMVVKNFGIAIILFTILIKLITFPLTQSQLKSTQKMQDLQNDPRYKRLKDKYGNDRERFAQEQMNLYKELGISPFGSCLPTLIQFPIIIGLYQAIMRAMASTPYELLNLERLVYPFLDVNKILPIQNQFLWMDLGQPERLNVFGIAVPVLTILVVLTSFVQTKVMAPPTDGAGDQAAAMSKSMNLYMPLMMGFFAYSLAAGLALYFLVTNLITIAQYAIMGRVDWSKIFSFDSPAPATASRPSTKPTKTKQLEGTGLSITETTGSAKEFREDKDRQQVINSDNQEPAKTPKPSARSITKQQRPKRKK